MRIIGPNACARNVNRVTTPKLPPPPRSAQNRSGCWPAETSMIGSNFFHYNPDPWGSWIEWFSDIDQIDDSWVAGEWEVPPHLWGAPPPETFLSNLEPRR
jgi:hypothetical protein